MQQFIRYICTDILTLAMNNQKNTFNYNAVCCCTCCMVQPGMR